MSGELRTVDKNGNTTHKPINVKIFNIQEGRNLLDSWKLQSDAWEEYARRKKNESI